MTNILVFGASNSRNSINRKFAWFAANLIPGSILDFPDLNDYEMPIYSIDREKESGIPEAALEFKDKIRKADGIIISFAEHNGAYSTAFKNIYDWISRIEANVWNNTPMLLLSTAPGPMGGKIVLNLALTRFQRSNKAPMESFSLPSFEDNFHNDRIINEDLYASFKQCLDRFIQVLDNK